MSGLRVRVESWPQLMTKDLAAEYLCCSPRSIDKLQADGHLIPVKSHFGKRFTRSELDAYVQTLPEWTDPKDQ